MEFRQADRVAIEMAAASILVQMYLRLDGSVIGIDKFGSFCSNS